MNKQTIIPTRSWTSQASPSSPSGFYDVSFSLACSLLAKRPEVERATGGGEAFLETARIVNRLFNPQKRKDGERHREDGRHGQKPCSESPLAHSHRQKPRTAPPSAHSHRQQP